MIYFDVEDGFLFRLRSSGIIMAISDATEMMVLEANKMEKTPEAMNLP